jgi:carbonic anhydrase/acetyltransferase-like protein (isoleucine patch superfamily)
MAGTTPSPDDHRRLLGYLTVGETVSLAGAGVCVLDPASTLIATNAVIAAGAVLYPTAVVQCDASSRISVGGGTVLWPGTLLMALSGGEVTVGEGCELGPGGVQLKANTAGSVIRIGRGARLINGCEVVGVSSIGDGCQVIGAIDARSVRLEGGRGGYSWPEPDERGAVLKGSGLARGITLSMGQVMNLRPSFADAKVEAQSSYHPRPDRSP